MSDENYVVGSLYGVPTRFHRSVMHATENETIDHINNDRADNRRSNLRSATLRMQALNKMSTKDFPRGVSYNSETKIYTATWQAGEKAASQTFAVGKLGKKGALRRAMSVRMDKIRSSEDVAEAIFPLERINRALALYLAPSISSVAQIRHALEVLDQFGYNLWKIPNKGRFAKLAEHNDWSDPATEVGIMRIVRDAIKRLRASTGDQDEYSRRLLGLRDAVKITCDSKVPDVMIGGARKVSDSSVSDPLETVDIVKPRGITKAAAAVQSAAIARASILINKSIEPELEKASRYSFHDSIGEPISMSEEEVKEKIREVLEETSHVITQPPIEVSETLAKEDSFDKAAVDKQELIDEQEELIDKLQAMGKDKDIIAATAACVRKLATAAITPEEKIAIEAKKAARTPRTKILVDSAREWGKTMLVSKENSVVSKDYVLKLYLAWAKGRGGKVAGPVQLSNTLRTLGYNHESMTVYPNCAIVE
jgi:hypothetical protein